MIFLFWFACQNTTNKERDHLSAQQEQSVIELSSSWLKQALENQGYQQCEDIPNGYQTTLNVEWGTWQLSVQYFKEFEIIYIAINDYLWIDQAKTSQQTVFTLTQLATRNHALLGAKLQLNPQNGAITLSAEIPMDKTFSEQQFQKVLHRLIEIAKAEYPMLHASLGISQY